MIDNKIDIAVCVVTYNQEQYIEQCLNSILQQNVDCNCKIYIGEDNSTDKTLEICRKIARDYPNKITIIENNTNLGLVKNTINTLKRIQNDGAKYIAILDGDDYWLNNEKLKKQYYFLETNEDYGLVYTHSALLLKNKLHYNRQILLDGKIPLKQMRITPIPNNTVMFKTSLLNLISLNEFIDRNFMSCDYAMYVYFSQYTKIKGLDFFSAVVRRGHSSVSHQSDLNMRIKYIDNDIAQFKYLSDKFPHEFSFTKEDEKNHKDYMTYKIAVKYGRYDIVKEILHQNTNIKKLNNSVLFKTKIFFSSNKFLFSIWYFFSKSIRYIFRL